MRRNVDSILAATERAATLTQSLLAFSKKHELKPGSLNLNEVIIEMEKLMAGLVRAGYRVPVTSGASDLIISGGPASRSSAS